MRSSIEEKSPKMVDVSEIENGQCFQCVGNGLIYMVTFIVDSDEDEFTCTDLEDGCTWDMSKFNKVIPLTPQGTLTFKYK